MTTYGLSFAHRKQAQLGLVFVAAAAAMISLPADAQTSTPGPEIDIEVYNPEDGSNLFCVAPGSLFEARIWVRPGSEASTCTLSCGSADGGIANLATAVVDMVYSGTMLTMIEAESNPNPNFAAVDGLIQNNSAEHRIGWALAGDWEPNGDTGGQLSDPCTMQKLDEAGWIFRVEFIVNEAGTSHLTLRQAPEFALSFADVCSPEAFTEDNGGIDEILHALVSTQGPECSGLGHVIFVNGFEAGSTLGWS